MQVQFPTNQLTGAADAAALALFQERKKLLEVVGIQLLQYAQLDYVIKARGGTGSDGIAWAPLQVATILARLRRKAGHLKAVPIKDAKLHSSIPVGKTQKQVLVVARTVKANQKLFNQLVGAGVQFHNPKTGKAIIGDRARYKAGTVLSGTTKNASKTVKQTPGSYEIGVDTGLQRSSARPGFMASDSLGGNVQQMEADSITVGFGRSYSAAFDKHRKLFPEILPVAWVEELQAMVAEAGGQVIADTFKKEGMS